MRNSIKQGWQTIGGKLEIPDGWFVHYVNLDFGEPYANIINEKTNKEETINIPKSLAYYLSTHFCGSKKMRDVIAEAAKNEIRNTIKGVLKL